MLQTKKITPSDTDLEEAQRLAAAALDHARQHQCPPKPRAYEIWYTYAADSDEALRARVDQELINTNVVDLDTIEQIYEDHFLQKRLSRGYTRIGDDQDVERQRLSIGLSAAPGLVPFTKAKGKNGAGTSSSVVIASVGMGVKYAPGGELPDEYSAGVVCDAGEWAAPGPVSASVRLQYLSVSADLYPTVDEVVTDCVLNAF